jgi:hypothetical protein
VVNAARPQEIVALRSDGASIPVQRLTGQAEWRRMTFRRNRNFLP